MEYNFNVNENEANLILQALGELPAKYSFELIQKLKNQASEQTSK